MLLEAKETGQISRRPNRSEGTVEFGAAQAEADLEAKNQPMRVTLQRGRDRPQIVVAIAAPGAMDAANSSRRSSARPRKCDPARRASRWICSRSAPRKRAGRIAATWRPCCPSSRPSCRGPMVPAVYLDPPWKRQGGIGDRAYENHYPTMTWPQILDYLRQARRGCCPTPGRSCGSRGRICWRWSRSSSR
jgi:hypothetical protein